MASRIKKLFTVCAITVHVTLLSQQLEAIDKKGNIVNINNNKVTTATTAPIEPIENDVWLDTSNNTNTRPKIWNGSSWLGLDYTGTPGSIFYTGNDNLPTQDNGNLFWNATTKRLGIGTDNPFEPLHIVGPDPLITLQTTNSGGESGIIMYSNVNFGSDYGYMVFKDNGSDNGSTNENGLLEIGVEDDAAGTTFQDDIALMPSGSVGISTRGPTAKLDVNGNIRVRNLPAGANGDEVITTDSNGNLRKLALSSVQTNTTIEQNNTTGVITHNSEDGNTQSVNVISSDANNSITAGSDGGSYFNSPIKAYGTLTPATNTYTASGISSVTKPGVGRYIFTFLTPRSTNNYPIQLTVQTTGTNDYNIYVTEQTTTTFSIAIVQQAFSGIYADRTFYFTVLDF